MLLQAFGGYTRASLGEEPAEWCVSMYLRLNPEASQQDVDAKGEAQESWIQGLLAQGLSIQDVKGRLRQRR